MVSISSRSSGQDLRCLTAARKEGASEGSRWCAPSALHHFAACRVPLATPKISDVRSDECASDRFIAASAEGGVRQGWSSWWKDKADERDWKTRSCRTDGAQVYSWDVVQQICGWRGHFWQLTGLWTVIKWNDLYNHCRIERYSSLFQSLL